MKRIYRKGGIGALMDEYERAANELKSLITKVNESDFLKIADTVTKDTDCQSVQTIVSHVLNSGYSYADYIRKYFSIPKKSPERRLISQQDFPIEFDKMLAYTSETLDGKWEYPNEEIQKIKIVVRWGPEYDIEQLLEHAIVHILRHRRQIEKFANNGIIFIK